MMPTPIPTMSRSTNVRISGLDVIELTKVVIHLEVSLTMVVTLPTISDTAIDPVLAVVAFSSFLKLFANRISGYGSYGQKDWSANP